MKKLGLFMLVAIGLSACSINKQAQQVKALEKCEYRFVDAKNVTLAGTPVDNLLKGNIDLSAAPGLALGYLRKDIPLRATVNLEINNPSAVLAAINNFQYIIQINRQDVAQGTMNQPISIDAGQKTIVPLQINANIYQFVNNTKVRDEIMEFLAAGKNGNEKKGLVTLKIKPSIMVGNSLVQYPGYISIDKEISSKILL